VRIILLIACAIIILSADSCSVINKTAKYNFNDGIYRTGMLSKTQVYVYKINDDTIVVFPVKEYPDSTAILTNQRTVYSSLQKKFKDNKTNHTFYKPSLDVDLMTMPLLYRPASNNLPNQLITNFNGALYVGYRTDAYHLNYERTPLNTYKQDVKHYGYSVGLFAGVGSTLIDDNVLKGSNTPVDLDYEGMTLIYGVAANMAVQSINFGISCGLGHLLDKYHEYWIYQGKPFIGFTLGINLD
jgi:hypothetical protein